jgi:hypothetical protein
MNLRYFPIIPVLAALAGGCLFDVEADIPEVQVTQHGVKVPGVAQSTRIGDVSVTTSFTFSSANTAWAKHMNSQVLARQVTVTSTGGVPNLDFIKSVRLTMSDPATSKEATALISYERCDEAPSSSIIEVNMPKPIDITPLWSADQTIIGLTLGGRLPEDDWTVDVTLMVGGKITYKY